jgi:glycosyltransferase involved in cell wall biosynthesis
MRTDRTKILFISHDASRTGAPLYLLNFLKWFKASTEFAFLILLRVGGEMESQFQELAPTFIIDRYSRNHDLFLRNCQNLWFRIEGLRRQREIDAQLRMERIGLIYSNTMTNGKLLRVMSYLNCPVITHVHELEQLIRRYGPRNLRLVLNHTDHYIAASEAVRSNLVRRHQVPRKNIDVVHSAIPIRTTTSRDWRQSRARIFECLAIPSNALVVGGCGSTSLIKGTDLFVKLARLIRLQYFETPVHFVWVGPQTRELRFNALLRQIDHSGLKGYVHFVGNQVEPLDYFAAFDVLALTSREESFGLVMLEVASLAKPTVCFGGAGGPGEFVENDCGYVIPGFNLSMMAKKIIELLKSQDLRERFGGRAGEKISERHTMDITATRILNVMDRTLTTAGSLSS